MVVLHDKKAGPRAIIGLGNPGKVYTNTRHNIGFRIVESLAVASNLAFKRSRDCRGMIARGLVEKQDCFLFLPTTYMNRCGIAAKALVQKFQIDLCNVLVVCDDFSLSFGQLRLRRSGRDGGHNGLGSLIAELGTRDFARLRIGIDSPRKNQDSADYVLEQFKVKELRALDSIVQEARECCQGWLGQEMSQVMSQFNKRKDYE